MSENSFRTTKILIKNAAVSAAGAENKMPSSPQNSGKIRISGISRSTCLDRDSNMPFMGFPMAEKKLADNICTLFIITIIRKIRMKRIVNSMYSFSPEPNSEMMYWGKNWKTIKESTDITKEHLISSL